MTATSSMIIMGIDIGAQGAIAILDQSGALLTIHDMPVLQDGPKGRPRSMPRCSLQSSSRAMRITPSSRASMPGPARALQELSPLGAPAASSRGFWPPRDFPWRLLRPPTGSVSSA
jgi:hypothetical protein